jgi:hypothetical protein
MNKYTKWKRETNRKLRRKLEEDRDIHIFHSHFFHRYFEGYTEYRDVDEKGKVHIRREYTGTVYISELSGGEYWLLRAVYVILFAAMLYFLYQASMRQTAFGNNLFLVLPEIATVACFFWMFYTLLVSYVFAPKRMTIDDYRTSSGSLIRVSKLLAVLSALDALVSFVLALIGHAAAEGYMAALFFLGNAAIAAIIFLIEQKTPYQEIVPQKSPDDEITHGIEIDSI